MPSTLAPGIHPPPHAGHMALLCPSLELCPSAPPPRPRAPQAEHLHGRTCSSVLRPCCTSLGPAFPPVSPLLPCTHTPHRRVHMCTHPCCLDPSPTPTPTPSVPCGPVGLLAGGLFLSLHGQCWRSLPKTLPGCDGDSRGPSQEGDVRAGGVGAQTT